jgi:hypothetical protein
MSRRGYTTSRSAPDANDQIHPVWRGIGCLMLVIIPVMSFALSVILLDQNAIQGWFEIPNELDRLPVPDFMTDVLPNWITGDFYAKLLLTVVFSLLIFGVFTIFYSLVYRMSGGYATSPTDAPPIKRKARKSR